MIAAVVCYGIGSCVHLRTLFGLATSALQVGERRFVASIRAAAVVATAVCAWCPATSQQKVSRSLTTMRYVWPLRMAISSMPITFGAGVPARASCARMYCLSSSLTVCQSRPSSLATFLDRPLAAAPADEDGKPLGVKRIVGQECELLPLHLAARSAKDAPDLDLKIHTRVAARQIAHAPQRAVVPAPMQASAVGAARFFERRFSLMIRAFGSPKMPRTVPSGRKPQNAYASHSRRFRLPEAAIEIPSSSEPPHTRSEPCYDAAFRCVKL